MALLCFNRATARALRALQRAANGMQTNVHPAEQVIRGLGGYESARRKKKKQRWRQKRRSF
jgi:hypothetical protein